MPVFRPVGVARRRFTVPTQRRRPVCFTGHQSPARQWRTPVSVATRKVRPGSGVAVVAALTDLVAAPPRVEGVVAPVDACRVAHQHPPIVAAQWRQPPPAVTSQAAPSRFEYALNRLSPRRPGGVVSHVDSRIWVSPAAPLYGF